MRKLVLSVAAFLTACNASGVEARTEAVDEPTVVPVRDEPDSRPGLSGNYAEFKDIIAHHQQLAERVDRISRQLRVANAPLCERTRLDIGITTHELADYPDPIQPLALHFMDLEEEGRFIRSVVPGSPADRVRLQSGDEIVSGWPLRSDEAFQIDGYDQAVTIPLEPDTACHIPTFVVNAGTLNATTDGFDIELSTRLVEQVGDDNALALIIAHEMAHVISGDTVDMANWETELRADRNALVLMRNAGFDIGTTLDIWAEGVELHRDSQAMSATHPPIEIRLRNLETVRDSLAQETDAFLSLE